MGLPERPRSRNGAGLPAVTAEQIVDAAVGLTAESGLGNWTLRQLAARIEASPAVVYHHVGDREAVVCLVLERVVRELAVPPETLPWRKWFERLLADHRVVLRKYPGVAYRLAMHGAPVVDLGVRLLQEAGFDSESVLAYNVLLTTACHYIAMEDTPGGYRESTGLVAASEKQAELFQYAVQRCLDGLECRLNERKA
ncbi:AcrR family transcriptional regulator [Kibdelosporangium banguiense]|uniref:AcrR family transcriptional regulator n=1 Tax=Kibdelosporangium banguiense TaxID=1365924 RepID=A0ABS4TMQ9_9PSEU|nr:TetR/AcrR family transcriptional regulator [Kibdelosporangium banguiense]MBP2325701.1 AcrR family transcriptional regulator [Kibdelosporangium banguiense]